MQYILTGFRHEVEFRVFVFEGIREDRVRIVYLVRADLTLSRKYGIKTQDLPLLCRRLLERRDTNDIKREFTYTEAAMHLHADACAAEAAAHKKKPPRRPLNTNAGASWRNPQL